MIYNDLLKMGKALVGNDRGFDVELLLSYCTGWSRGLLHGHLNDEASEEIEQIFRKHIQEMIEGRPVQYIMGGAYFNGIFFKVREGVLIPRFDTEILLEVVKNEISRCNREVDILELCVGSGAVSVSMALENPNHCYYASDIADIPLAIAEENSKKYGVTLCLKKGDLFEPWCCSKFDIILANPPYIDDEEMKKLDKIVLKEPRLALYGGRDGLDFYRKIILKAKKYLKNQGFLAVEIGYNQGPDVVQLFEENGYYDVSITKDFQQHDRVVSGRIE